MVRYVQGRTNAAAAETVDAPPDSVRNYLEQHRGEPTAAWRSHSAARCPAGRRRRSRRGGDATSGSRQDDDAQFRHAAEMRLIGGADEHAVTSLERGGGDDEIV